MNALYLIAATVVAFVFGYRFYAKLLTLDTFGLEPNYSTRAQSRPDGQDYVPTHPQLLLGHHVAAITGVAAFAAPVAALAWGWIPVFLWITVGSAVAAGTYGLGAFWLSSRHAGGLGRLTYDLVGGRAHAIMQLLAAIALVILVAASAGFTAIVLQAHPAAVLAVGTIALTACGFGTYLHGRAESELWPASAAMLVAALLLTWLLANLPLALNGALSIALGKVGQISIDGVVVWTVLVLVYAFHAARLPVWKLMRPRGFVVAMMLVLMMLLFYAAMVIQHPALTAPEFHSPPSKTGALPWLFLIVGSGAFAGWHILVIGGVTGRELRRETDARYVGYGAALIQGLVALSAVLLAAAAFTERTVWLRGDAGLPAAADLPRAVQWYIEAYAGLVTTLGIDHVIAETFAATVIAGLSLAVLEGAARALKNVLVDVAPASPATPQTRGPGRAHLRVAIIGGGILALYDGHGLGGLAAWPSLALVSLWLAAAGFSLMTLALRRMQRPALIPSVLAVAAAAAAIWGSAVQFWQWWRAAAWAEFGVGAVVVLLAVVLACDLIAALRHPPTQPEPPSNLTPDQVGSKSGTT